MSPASRPICESDRTAQLFHELGNLVTILECGLPSVREAVARLVRDGEKAPLLDELGDLAFAAEACGGLLREAHRPPDARADLIATARRAVRLLGPMTPPGTTLEVEAAPAVVARCDAHDLVRIIVNLVRNGMLAGAGTPRRATRVRISAAAVRSEAVLAVEDDGPGIAESDRERVFEPGYTTRAELGGMGHGLAACRALAAAWGGTIAFDPHAREGARVELRLPLDATARPHAGLPRVLVVDDHPVVARSLLRALGAEYEVRGAATGAEAIDAIAGADFDAVLCDLNLEDAGLQHVLDWIGLHRPEVGRRMAIVTGGARTPELEAFLSTTDLPVLLKPARASELRALVADLVEARRAPPLPAERRRNPRLPPAGVEVSLPGMSDRIGIVNWSASGVRVLGHLVSDREPVHVVLRRGESELVVRMSVVREHTTLRGSDQCFAFVDLDPPTAAELMAWQQGMEAKA